MSLLDRLPFHLRKLRVDRQHEYQRVWHTDDQRGCSAQESPAVGERNVAGSSRVGRQEGRGADDDGGEEGGTAVRVQYVRYKLGAV